VPEHAIDNRHLVAAGPCKQSTFTAIAGQCQRRYNVFHRLSVIFDQEDFIRYVASRSHYSFLPKSECARGQITRTIQIGNDRGISPAGASCRTAPTEQSSALRICGHVPSWDAIQKNPRLDSLRPKLSGKNWRWGLRIDWISLESQMPDQAAIVVSAVFAGFLAGVALTTVSGAARAGNDCLTEPKDQPPQGSHWYYHVDQVTHHKCWHRRAEGLTIHQVGSSKPYPPAKPILQQGAEVDRQEPTADSHTEQPIVVEVQSTTAGRTGQSTPETSTDAAGGENPPPSILSSRWPDPQSRGELDHERELAHSAAADAGIDSQGRMLPVFTRDQVAAAERPPESSTDRMRLAVLGALALTVATGGLVFKYSAARRLRRGDILDQRGSASTHFLSIGRTDTSSRRHLRSIRAKRAQLRD